MKIAPGLADTWKRVHKRLAKDRVFRKLGGKATVLDRLTPPSWEKLWEALCEGEPAERWAGLALTAEHAGAGRHAIKGDLVVRAGLRFFAGNVTIRGNLVVGAQAAVIASGDLKIEGNLVASHGQYTCVASGGTLSAKAGGTTGELLARKTIEIAGPLWERYNDYSSMTPRLAAGVLVRLDRYDDVLRVKLKDHLVERHNTVEEIADAIGLPGFENSDELATAFWTWLRTGKAPKPKAVAVSPDAQRAMAEAVRANNARRLREALAAGADAKGRDGIELLVEASHMKRHALVEILLAAGADASQKSAAGYSVLHAAEYDAVLVKRLLRAGADPHALDPELKTPLHAAWANAEAIRALLAAGADPAASDDLDRTPLHIAAQSSDAAAVRALIAGRAPLDARDKDGKTPLWYACERGHLAIVKLLLAARAKPNAADKRGRTPLFAVATSLAAIDLKPVVRALLAAGARPDVRDRKGKQAAQVAPRARRDVVAALSS